MQNTEYAISQVNRSLIDISTIKETDYISGEIIITVEQWTTNPSICYFAKSTATVSLHCLSPSIQDLWRLFEIAVLSYLKQANAQNL